MKAQFKKYFSKQDLKIVNTSNPDAFCWLVFYPYAIRILEYGEEFKILDDISYEDWTIVRYKYNKYDFRITRRQL